MYIQDRINKFTDKQVASCEDCCEIISRRYEVSR